MADHSPNIPRPPKPTGILTDALITSSGTLFLWLWAGVVENSMYLVYGRGQEAHHTTDLLFNVALLTPL